MSGLLQLRLGLAGTAIGLAMGGLIVFAPTVRPPPPRGPITAPTSAPAEPTATPITNALPDVTSAPAPSETAVEGSEARPTETLPAAQPTARPSRAALATPAPTVAPAVLPSPPP